MAVHGYAAPQSVIAIAQDAPGTELTGTTNEATLATITIPGGMMGAKGRVVIDTLWTVTNSANNKTLRVKFGGTTYLSGTVTTSASVQVATKIANKSASSQVGFANNALNGVGSSTTANQTSSVDTTADVTVLITGQLANAGESIKLESYSVEVRK